MHRREKASVCPTEGRVGSRGKSGQCERSESVSVSVSVSEKAEGRSHSRFWPSAFSLTLALALALQAQRASIVLVFLLRLRLVAARLLPAGLDLHGGRVVGGQRHGRLVADLQVG